MAPRVPSEEILGRKWDRCLADTTIKIGKKMKGEITEYFAAILNFFSFICTLQELELLSA